MFMNFSMPMSAPKPLSVTTQSASLRPIRSAMIELLPCAMFAKGPACTKTGVFSIVWSSVGLMASRSSTAMAPAVPSCSAVTAWPSWSRPITMRPRRWRKSFMLVVRPRIAMTSDATAMSKPVSRGRPFSRPPRPITTLRSARSLTSTTRGQVMDSGSMRSLLRVGDRVVDHRGEQVVGERDRVDVARQVQVEVLHRDHLRIAAPRRAALDAEDRPERRLADGRDGPRSHAVERHREPDGRRRLALAERRRGDGRHVDVLAVRAAREPLHERQHDLGLVLAVQLELVLLDAEAGGDLARWASCARAARSRDPTSWGLSPVGSSRGRYRPVRTAARSMRTAQTLYSGIFDDGSWAEFVRKFAAESASLTKGTKIAPGRTASVRRAKASTRRVATRRGSGRRSRRRGGARPPDGGPPRGAGPARAVPRRGGSWCRRASDRAAVPY